MVKSLLTKICSVCGLSKPLTAYLVMSGSKGASYGNICSSCRKTAMEKKNAPKEAGGSTTSSTGKTITSKEKAKWDVDKEKEKLKLHQDYYEEREQKEQKESLQTEKKETIDSEVKKHRGGSFLDNRSYLTNASKAEIKRQFDKQNMIESAAAQTALEDVANKQDEVAKHEQKQREIDTIGPYLPSQTGAQAKLSGDTFLRFRTLLGKGAPMVKQAQTTAQQIDPNGEALEEKETDVVNRTFNPKR